MAGPGKALPGGRRLAAIDRHVGGPAAAAVEHRPRADRPWRRRGGRGALASPAAWPRSRPGPTSSGSRWRRWGCGVRTARHSRARRPRAAPRASDACRAPLRQLDHDLMALADIAHEGHAALEGRHAARARRDQRRRLRAHLFQELAGRRRIERVEAHVAAAHQLVGRPARRGSPPPSRRRHWAARSRASRRSSRRRARHAAARRRRRR